MPRKTEIISFRATASILARIDKAAQPLELSRGDWVREIVIAHFHNLDDALEWPAQIADFREAQEHMQQAIEQIQQNQRRQVFVELTHIGKLDSEKAKDIIRCNLLS